MNNLSLDMVTTCIYVLIGLVLCLIFAVAFLLTKYYDLFTKYYDMKDTLHLMKNLINNCDEMNGILSNEIDDIEINVREVNDKRFNDISNSLIMREKELSDLRELLDDIVDTVFNKLDIIDEKLIKFDLTSNKPVIDISDGDTDGDVILEGKPPKYEWQYCDDIKIPPIPGETYIIVGRIKGANNIDIENENGNYGVNGKFYKADGTPFEKVFAFVRMPKASDIQSRLFSLIKKDILR